MTDADDVPRRCRRTRPHLAAHADGTLSRWRRRLVEGHIGWCDACTAILDEQVRVADGLADLSPGPETEDPPEDLLDALLEKASQPDVRARAAVPLRGAVSGARPRLSITLVVVALAVGVGAGYLTWRAGHALLRRTPFRRRD